MAEDWVCKTKPCVQNKALPAESLVGEAPIVSSFCTGAADDSPDVAV